tara:strand:+ start:173 stop:343 length:171 start_codon:yes stop_codon:yes gene_type:complete
LKKSLVNIFAILFCNSIKEVKTEPPIRKNMIPLVDKSSKGTKKYERRNIDIANNEE